ncbi:hypothetical protein C7M84_021214 [Penaeus vannamei]|uniref:Uncharacterized protein n=1 Tax=Penaeus vannamei TaxID=6689 RepID=A0A423SA12_PENVA|nr:hypothetical protein C7M84_021214 [Penaeus vannamei]
MEKEEEQKEEEKCKSEEVDSEERSVDLRRNVPFLSVASLLGPPPISRVALLFSGSSPHPLGASFRVPPPILRIASLQWSSRHPPPWPSFMGLLLIPLSGSSPHPPQSFLHVAFPHFLRSASLLQASLPFSPTLSFPVGSPLISPDALPFYSLRSPPSGLPHPFRLSFSSWAFLPFLLDLPPSIGASLSILPDVLPFFRASPILSTLFLFRGPSPIPPGVPHSVASPPFLRLALLSGPSLLSLFRTPPFRCLPILPGTASFLGSSSPFLLTLSFMGSLPSFFPNALLFRAFSPILRTPPFSGPSPIPPVSCLLQGLSPIFSDVLLQCVSFPHPPDHLSFFMCLSSILLRSPPSGLSPSFLGASSPNPPDTSLLGPSPHPSDHSLLSWCLSPSSGIAPSVPPPLSIPTPSLLGWLSPLLSSGPPLLSWPSLHSSVIASFRRFPRILLIHLPFRTSSSIPPTPPSRASPILRTYLSSGPPLLSSDTFLSGPPPILLAPSFMCLLPYPPDVLSSGPSPISPDTSFRCLPHPLGASFRALPHSSWRLPFRGLLPDSFRRLLFRGLPHPPFAFLFRASPPILRVASLQASPILRRFPFQGLPSILEASFLRLSPIFLRTPSFRALSPILRTFLLRGLALSSGASFQGLSPIPSFPASFLQALPHPPYASLQGLLPSSPTPPSGLPHPFHRPLSLPSSPTPPSGLPSVSPLRPPSWGLPRSPGFLLPSSDVLFLQGLPHPPTPPSGPPPFPLTPLLQAPSPLSLLAASFRVPPPILRRPPSGCPPHPPTPPSGAFLPSLPVRLPSGSSSHPPAPPSGPRPFLRRLSFQGLPHLPDTSFRASPISDASFQASPISPTPPLVAPPILRRSLQVPPIPPTLSPSVASPSSGRLPHLSSAPPSGPFLLIGLPVRLLSGSPPILPACLLQGSLPILRRPLFRAFPYSFRRLLQWASFPFLHRLLQGLPHPPAPPSGLPPVLRRLLSGPLPRPLGASPISGGLPFSGPSLPILSASSFRASPHPPAPPSGPPPSSSGASFRALPPISPDASFRASPSFRAPSQGLPILRHPQGSPHPFRRILQGSPLIPPTPLLQASSHPPAPSFRPPPSSGALLQGLPLLRRLLQGLPHPPAPPPSSGASLPNI